MQIDPNALPPNEVRISPFNEMMHYIQLRRNGITNAMIVKAKMNEAYQQIEGMAKQTQLELTTRQQSSLKNLTEIVDELQTIQDDDTDQKQCQLLAKKINQLKEKQESLKKILSETEDELSNNNEQKVHLNSQISAFAKQMKHRKSKHAQFTDNVVKGGRIANMYISSQGRE